MPRLIPLNLLASESHVQFVISLMTLAAGAALGFLPSYLSRLYVSMSLSVAAVLLVGAAVYVANQARKHRGLLLVFRFPRAFATVAAVVQDQHGVDTMSDHERRGFELHVAPSLASIGLRTVPVFCSDAELATGHDRDLFLLGGPVNNALSRDLNDRLKGNATYNGFFFEPTDKCSSQATDPEAEWCIKHSRLLTVEAPYCGLPKYSSTEDVGMLYVGPNPLSPRRWLIWVAGIGPIGTYAALAALTDSAILRFAEAELTDPDRYLSALVKWESPRGVGTAGEVTAVLVTAGTRVYTAHASKNSV